MVTSFGGISLRGDEGSKKSGGIFELDKPPNSNQALSVSTDWTVEFQEGLRYVIAHSPLGLSRERTLDEGIDAAQKALDLLCVVEHQRLRVQNFEREHMIWYEEDGRSILRAMTVSGLGLSAKVAVDITHADGTMEEPDRYPVLPWHECFRYYRLSQVSDDPFDAFRNLWLSLELAFSLKSAMKPGEREVDWLKRVGQEFKETLPPTAWPSAGADPVQDMVKDHYVDTRCRLFHAKGGKLRLNPHVAADRRTVIDRFSTLQPFVREVLSDVAGAPRGGGVVTYEGFKHMMRVAHGDGLILLSDSKESVRREETVTSDCWLSAGVVPGPRMAAESRPGLELRGSRVKTKGLAPIKVCRIGLASKGSDGAAEILHTSSIRSAMLELENDFEEFEPVCGIELVNLSSPRTRFKL